MSHTRFVAVEWDVRYEGLVMDIRKRDCDKPYFAYRRGHAFVE